MTQQLQRLVFYLCQINFNYIISISIRRKENRSEKSSQMLEKIASRYLQFSTQTEVVLKHLQNTAQMHSILESFYQRVTQMYIQFCHPQRYVSRNSTQSMSKSFSELKSNPVVYFSTIYMANLEDVVQYLSFFSNRHSLSIEDKQKVADLFLNSKLCSDTLMKIQGCISSNSPASKVKRLSGDPIPVRYALNESHYSVIKVFNILLKYYYYCQSQPFNLKLMLTVVKNSILLGFQYWIYLRECIEVCIVRLLESDHSYIITKMAEECLQVCILANQVIFPSKLEHRIDDYMRYFSRHFFTFDIESINMSKIKDRSSAQVEEVLRTISYFYTFFRRFLIDDECEDKWQQIVAYINLELELNQDLEVYVQSKQTVSSLYTLIHFQQPRYNNDLHSCLMGLRQSLYQQKPLISQEITAEHLIVDVKNIQQKAQQQYLMLDGFFGQKNISNRFGLFKKIIVYRSTDEKALNKLIEVFFMQQTNKFLNFENLYSFINLLTMYSQNHSQIVDSDKLFSLCVSLLPTDNTYQQVYVNMSLDLLFNLIKFSWKNIQHKGSIIKEILRDNLQRNLHKPIVFQSICSMMIKHSKELDLSEIQKVGIDYLRNIRHNIFSKQPGQTETFLLQYKTTMFNLFSKFAETFQSLENFSQFWSIKKVYFVLKHETVSLQQFWYFLSFLFNHRMYGQISILIFFTQKFKSFSNQFFIEMVAQFFKILLKVHSKIRLLVCQKLNNFFIGDKEGLSVFQHLLRNRNLYNEFFETNFCHVFINFYKFSQFNSEQQFITQYLIKNIPNIQSILERKLIEQQYWIRQLLTNKSLGRTKRKFNISLRSVVKILLVKSEYQRDLSAKVMQFYISKEEEQSKQLYFKNKKQLLSAKALMSRLKHKHRQKKVKYSRNQLGLTQNDGLISFIQKQTQINGIQSESIKYQLSQLWMFLSSKVLPPKIYKPYMEKYQIKNIKNLPVDLIKKKFSEIQNQEQRVDINKVQFEIERAIQESKVNSEFDLNEELYGQVTKTLNKALAYCMKSRQYAFEHILSDTEKQYIIDVESVIFGDFF